MMKQILNFFVILNLVASCTTLYAQKIDSLVLLKSERKLFLFSKGKKIKKYKVSLGGNPLGPKTKEGDSKTPEGNYIVDSKNPNGEFYKNLGVNYPNDFDKSLGRTGKDIKIHGLNPKYAKWGKLQTLKDWTNGCIAVSNKQMEEIYNLTEIKTPLIIYP